MKEATIGDKFRCIDILAHSFENNKSVNYVLAGSNSTARLRHLMEYSFNVCFTYGKVFLSEDNNACALILSHKSKYGLRKLLWDVKLMLFAFGISQLSKVLKREKIIAQLKNKDPHLYIWFIGVDPAQQGKGIGTQLMNDITEVARNKNMPICLETSTLENIPWYQKFGFDIYCSHDFTYRLFFLRKI